MSKAKKPLDARTLRAVARELTELSKSFHQTPSPPEFKRTNAARGDILGTWGRIYMRRANRLAYQERKAKASKGKAST